MYRAGDKQESNGGSARGRGGGEGRNRVCVDVDVDVKAKREETNVWQASFSLTNQFGQ